MKGLFVTFEGVDGAGKTTQLALLREALEHEGYAVCVTREPGGDVVAETVRHLLLTAEVTPRAELLLFLASRAQNVEQVIRPHLANGDIVLCDRFTDSSLAYQGHARGLGREWVGQLNAFATDGLVPDVTILLDLDPEIGLTRQSERNRMEAEKLDFHQRVRQGFLFEAANDAARFCVLDATRPPEALHAEILARVHAALAARQNPVSLSSPDQNGGPIT
ncbi:MAG TPA: dTMP kinase [Chthonomonadaceae bacterium]|nr:dTMP kinase [Chthonomonadaceae bacterium]